MALEMGEGGDAWLPISLVGEGGAIWLPLCLMGEVLVLPSLEEVALVFALGSVRFLEEEWEEEEGGTGGFLTAEERTKERGGRDTSG